jgi:hypothetical protein
VPTPADANLRSPYAANVFDGNVQAFVPPVPPGYKDQEGAGGDLPVLSSRRGG